MTKKIAFTREIPVRYETDVLVAGGGPAGIAAALAARRCGAQVLLIEGEGCFGGLGTAGLVPVFMTFTDGVNFLAGGIGQEVLTRLRQAGGTGPDGDNTIRAEVLKRVYDALLDESGVDYLLRTRLIAVEKNEGGQVTAAILAAKSGLFAAQAKVYIDCTGDGDLAAWAGAPFKKGDERGEMMAGTLCSLWADVDWDRVRASKWGAGESPRLEQAIQEGVLSQPDRHLPGMWRVGRRIGGGNIGHCFGVDGTDERSLTEAYVRGRKLLAEYERFYKEYMEGFEEMELVSTGSLMGIRETRRIMGDYVLALSDFQNRAVFPDEIGRYSYPIDVHASRADGSDFDAHRNSFQTLRLGTGESYGIPYRALIPQRLCNVLVAGRCISADRYMQGSVRVMPGCYITGQAAGAAAALAVKANGIVREVDTAHLQRRLKDLGAYLPNC